MKFKETEIQRYIWENREHFFDFIEVPTFEQAPMTGWSDMEPWEFLYYYLMDKYKANYELLKGMNLFGCEVRLDKKDESTIRTDFLGCFDGANGLVVCELKVNRDPERQAFTELGAYANTVRASFSPMGREDIFYLLIAPMEERIIREASINTILYDNNRAFVLIPDVGDTLDTLKLRVWMPSKSEFKILTKTAFAFENIDSFKITWRDPFDKWSPSEKGAKPTGRMIHQLNQVSAYAAQLMEARGINGFVYCSQLIPELRDAGYLENSITICGLNPFKATKTKMLYEHGVPLHEASEMSVEPYSIFNVFPRLEKDCKEANEEFNYWFHMAESWSSVIDEIAINVQSLLTKSISHKYERGWGTFTWETYLYQSSEDKGCKNYDIRLTGILRVLYTTFVERMYDAFNKQSPEIKTELIESHIIEPHYIDMLNSQYHVREFLMKFATESVKDVCDNPLPFDEIKVRPQEETVDYQPPEIDEDFLALIDQM